MKRIGVVLFVVASLGTGCTAQSTPSFATPGQGTAAATPGQITAAATNVSQPTQATAASAIPTAATSAPSPASSATSRASIGPTNAASPAGPSPTGSLANLAACDFQPPPGDHPWLCGTIDVPLDRADESAGTLTLTYMVLPHSDTSVPAGVPLFATPGGPGSAGFDDYVLYAIQPMLHKNHDIVTMDPRGTGLAGAIDCPAIQANPQTEQSIQAAVAACGQQLGTASSRYGAADRAMDVEAVRQALGYDKIDYYGASYGGVDIQAYAARFPERLNAVILDSTFPVNDPDHLTWTQAAGGPAAQVHTVALRCQRDSSCAAISPDPEAAILKMIETVRNQPVKGTPSTGANPSPITVDELAVTLILATAEPVMTVNAAVSLDKGDAGPLVDLAAVSSGIPPMSSEPVEWFSVGANMAGWCNDQDVAWDRNDPPATRRAKFDAYFAALPDDAFAPFSKATWRIFNFMGQCLDWPAPTNFTPVIPAGVSMPDVPALILSGDEDNSVPTDLSRALLKEFPNAKVVVIHGAGHPTMKMDGPCVPSIVGGFLEALALPDTSCADTPG